MSAFGFTPAPGTDFASGSESDIARRLDALAKRKHLRIFGISGARTPAHSVAVGGSANDPHTRGQGADIGVNGLTRASAMSLSDSDLASVGLYRPFHGAQEINHVQLRPHSDGGISVGAGIAGGAAGGAAIGAVGGPVGIAAGAAIGAVAGGLAAGPGEHAIHNAESTAASAAADAAQAGFTAALNALWEQIRGSAAYAGVFVLLVAAGAYLTVRGLTKTAGRPRGAPA